MHIFPHHKEAVETFNNISTHATFLLPTGPSNQRSLEGRKLFPWTPPTPVTDDPDYIAPAPVWISHPAWRSGFAPGESVVKTIRSATALTGIPLASHGRVLGDRSTLYKYENSHLIAVLTKSHARDSDATYISDSLQPSTRCTVYLLDSIRGTVLYSAIVPASRESLKGPKTFGVCKAKMLLVDNWFMYHYYDDDASGVGTRGWRMVSVELYEGGANVRTRRCVTSTTPMCALISQFSSGELSAESPKRAEVATKEQVYIFPYDVKDMATTSTKYGISSKDLVGEFNSEITSADLIAFSVINSKNQVQTFSRRFLDPRRPKDKPSAQEREEGLMQYDILLPDDPRRIVSHTYPLMADRLFTTSTQLESTSLVFAYGLDWFMTRVAPSGSFDVLSEEFNKLQLVLTVLGLGAAIAITRPLVRAKIRKAKWYY